MVLDRLSEVMERRGISDLELACEALISHQTAGRARKGIRINYNTARRIAKALDVSLNYLGAREDKPA